MINKFFVIKQKIISHSHFKTGVFVFFLLVCVNTSIFSADSDKNSAEVKNEQSITTITIKNARQTSYKKDEVSGNDTIVLEGSVVLSVEKDDVSSDISADKITYDRKTEMLYAEGNVGITTKSSQEGGEKTTASALLMNTATLEGVFDDGRVVQTQSDAINLPSGSTLIVFSDLFGKNKDNTIAFKNSSLTFCDDENPHWHIDATRTWLLPGGEFAFFNALLYVGVVPVLYFPAFYYPKDELVFNPVFGYRRREGYFVQNTVYLYGRKPLDSSSNSSSSSNDGKTNSATESLKGVYNFMKPTSLKNQKLEGLVLHNLDENYTGQTSNYFKIEADWYSNLGMLFGIDSKFQPTKEYLTQLDLKADIGLSKTLFKEIKNGAISYYNFSPAKGKQYSDTSNFLGFKLPFRYGADLEVALSKPFRFNLSLPIYSDPYYSYDFYNRSETMDWISYFLENTSSSNNSTKAEETISEISSFTWKMSSSWSPSISGFIKPYISSLSFNINSSVNISSLSTQFKTTDSNNKIVYLYDTDKYEEEWTNYTPYRKFYYPSLVTPASASLSISGTIFQWPLKKNSSKVKTDYVLMNIPEELTNKKLAENTSSEDQEEKEKSQIADKQIAEISEGINLTIIKPVLPDLDYSTSLKNRPEGLTYLLSYNVQANIDTQLAYASSNLMKPEDFKWENVRSYMYTLKIPVSLTSKLNYDGDFFEANNKFSYSPVFQKHPYLNTLEKKENETTNEYTKRVTDSGAYSETEAKNLIKADYNAESQNITNSNTFSIKPFTYLEHFKETGLSWNTNLKLFRRRFIGDADKPEWEDLILDVGDKDYVTENTINATLAASEFSEKLKQSLVVSQNLPPQLKKYSATLNLVFPYLTCSVGTSIQQKSENDDTWVKNPLQQSATLTLFDNTLSLTESYNYNLEENFSDSLKLAMNWKSFQISYVMSYTLGYDFDKTWVARNEKEFLPYSLSLSYAPATKTFYTWFNRISVAPGLNTSIVADLIKPTSSYLVFSPSLSFKINQFFTLTFSSTSRNSVLYRYFQSLTGHSGRIPGEQNIFLDLINSYRFDDEKIRQGSGFKLKSLNLDITHELHDWKFNMNFKIEPRLITEGNQKYYDFNPYITIGVIWNPMEGMKTQIVDEYGVWSVN